MDFFNEIHSKNKKKAYFITIIKIHKIFLKRLINNENVNNICVEYAD